MCIRDRFSHPGAEISKLGHFIVFLCFGLIAGLLWRKCGIYFAFVAIVVLALATEALQTLVYGRSPNVVDSILDVLGGLTGLVLGIVVAGLVELMIRDTAPDSQSED